MNRLAVNELTYGVCVPRASGDEPPPEEPRLWREECSPREWG